MSTKQLSQEQEARLGTAPDTELAQEWSIPLWKIVDRRNKLSIPAYRKHKVQLSPEQDARLGTAPDTELAQEWGIPLWKVTERRHKLRVPTYRKPRGHQWTPEQEARLWVEHDEVVAHDLGLATWEVSAHRHWLNIPDHLWRKQPSSRRKAHVWTTSRRKAHVWTAEQDALLGSATDRDLAARWELHPQTVKKRRLELGIPAFRNTSYSRQRIKKRLRK